MLSNLRVWCMGPEHGGVAVTASAIMSIMCSVLSLVWARAGAFCQWVRGVSCYLCGMLHSESSSGLWIKILGGRSAGTGAGMPCVQRERHRQAGEPRRFAWGLFSRSNAPASEMRPRLTCCIRSMWRSVPRWQGMRGMQCPQPEFCVSYAFGAPRPQCHSALTLGFVLERVIL